MAYFYLCFLIFFVNDDIIFIGCDHSKNSHQNISISFLVGKEESHCIFRAKMILFFLMSDTDTATECSADYSDTESADEVY